MKKPGRIHVGREPYNATVVLVTERDELGRPLAARFVHDEQTVDLEELAAGGTRPEFIIVYANRQTWGAPRPDSAAS